jgi:hypothetical protein
VGPEASGFAPLGETEWISMLLKAEILLDVLGLKAFGIEINVLFLAVVDF